MNKTTDSEILVDVQNVSKKFCRNLKRSLWYGVKDLTKSFVGIKDDKSQLRKDEFWAVKDISFQLRRGECLGLIGHNGAGKSTLLKMLNGLIRPDEGEIRMRGKVGALIELGAGSNPILTGRENVYINGQVLGFSRKEIDQKFDDIVAFSEIGEFIDTPVQNYSSGMKVRLGFAVAAQMEPDVLIIDEVLAVGDTGFQVKCFNTITELIKTTAVIFVSHSMPMVARMSSKLLLMKKGKKELYSDNTYQGIEKYYEIFKSETTSSSNDIIKLKDLILYSGENPTNSGIIKYAEKMTVSVTFNSKENFSGTRLSIAILDMSLRIVATLISHRFQVFRDHDNLITVEIPNMMLSPGRYHLILNFFENLFEEEDTNSQTEDLVRRKTITIIKGVGNFKMTGKDIVTHSPFILQGEWNLKHVTT